MEEFNYCQNSLQQSSSSDHEECTIYIYAGPFKLSYLGVVRCHCFVPINHSAPRRWPLQYHALKTEVAVTSCLKRTWTNKMNV
jgi:hypothetical protein